MLVLTRRLSAGNRTPLGASRENETVVLGPTGERIVFKILASKRGSHIRVGIEAPPDMTILRGEIEHDCVEPETGRSAVLADS
jgi:sRNA-binding carbon storage regulator CsrA